MAIPKTGSDLLQLLKQSQILNVELLDKVLPQLARHGEGDPRRLAKTLVKNALISEYQAKQLLAGRYKGFYIGKYKIVAAIGQGGMGKVFLAEQITMERLVALKVVGRIKKKSREKEILARFKREAKAVAALHHENIVHAYDFDEENGVPYIVMEFVEGIDTAAMVGKFGPIHWKQACEYIRQAAQGLQHAHDAGLVHRDIKPGNLLVDRKGTIKILDLGLCSAFGDQQNDSLTVDQDQLGTVDYIAPEQAVDSHSADHRADIYSLGATFYSLLCGKIMYPDKSTAQKLMLHQKTDPRPLQDMVKDLPQTVVDVVAKMLKKNPVDRYQSGKEIAKALETLCEAKVPAYDESVIKFKRSDFEPLVGRAPEFNEITIQTLKDSSSTLVESDSGNTNSQSQVSQITTSNAFAEVDPLTMLGDFTELGVSLPPRRTRKKGKKKKDMLSGSLIALLAGGATLAVLIVLGTVLFARTGLSREDAPKPVIASAGRAVPPVTFSEWNSQRHNLLNDPSLLCYYSFQATDLNNGILQNAVPNGTFGALDVAKAEWSKGRWDTKGAVRLHGHRSGEYVAFNDEDSHKLDFLTSTSAMMWFKVETFEVVWQALMGKGDYTWRLQRLNSSDKLAFCMNKPSLAGSANSSNPGHIENLMRLEGRTSVTDGKWHQAVIVFDAERAVPEMRLYLDGKLENRMNAAFPFVDDKQVWIGANSDTGFRAGEANAVEGKGIRTFNGTIDEVAFWSKAMSNQDVALLYQMGKPAQ